jgi:VPDSG-CTERM motif
MATKKRVVYGILALVSLLGLGITQSARANFIETVSQVGTNVVATGSGAIDLNGLFFIGVFTPTASQVRSNDGLLVTGPTGFLDGYFGFSPPISGPTGFGTSSTSTFGTGSGDEVGIWGLPHLILVPQFYVSGDPLTSSGIWLNQTFGSLGLTPGTYEWTWGDGGANQNFTLIIGESVPDSGSTLSLLGLALVGLGVVRRMAAKLDSSIS